MLRQIGSVAIRRLKTKTGGVSSLEQELFCNRSCTDSFVIPNIAGWLEFSRNFKQKIKSGISAYLQGNHVQTLPWQNLNGCKRDVIYEELAKYR